MLKTVVYQTPGEFLTAAGDILRSDEARYGLVYGIALSTAENLHHYGEENPWFCSINDEHGIIAAAWRTPPYQPGLVWIGGDPTLVAPLLAKEVLARWQVIPGIIGQREIVEPFVDEWCRIAGVTVFNAMEMRIYRLDVVNEVSPASGRLRPATMADRDLVGRWLHCFNIDCFGETAELHPEEDMTPKISSGWMYLWEDKGLPVSMCCKNRPTDKAMTISYVYTPPEQRGRGYATSCVSAVCREILGSGKEFCTLYADLANPYSNAAYVKAGFYPVCDSMDCTFTVPD